MNKIIYVLALPILTWSANSQAESYKCKTPDGKTIYSGQLSLTPGVTCEQMFIRKKTAIENAAEKAAPAVKAEDSVDTGGLPPPSNEPPSAPNAKTPQKESDQSMAKPQDKKKLVDEEKKKAIASEEATRIKQANCENAKTNLRTYTTGGRISKIDDKGERVYLDDVEIRQKQDEAQKEVDKWCNS